SICLTTRFDGGKLHDVTFVGMQRQDANRELTRNSLGLASQTTILYAASVFDVSKQLGVLAGQNGSPNPLGPLAQKISESLTAAGINAGDWEAAFGSELGLIADWPEQMRWPSAVLTASVKDQARGRKIIDALLQGWSSGAQWEQGDKDGAHFWYFGG